MAPIRAVTDPALSTVLQTSSQARDEAAALIELTEQLKAQDAIPADSLIEFTKHEQHLLAGLASLKAVHRAANLEARQTKVVTAEARQEVDKLLLDLQNLNYQQKQAEAEIYACESYDHKYTQLPLIPVEEFLEQHPEHVEDDETALMIARIDHEKAERETLEQQRQELLKRKQKLIAENKKRKDDLANLDKDLERFIDAAKPIQKLFEKVV